MSPREVATKLGADQLAALSAVIESGTFDAAAERLFVTPSAISQRVKALETRVGQVLVVRGRPCRATSAATPLLRLAAQIAMLETEALAETGGVAGQARIALAVNADSMATWFTRVLERLPGVLFDIRIEDQDHSAGLLREGSVMGAVTTERTPVSGCRVQSLGVMRYVPVASVGYARRHFADGFTEDAARRAPSLAWNREDALQDRLLRKVFRRVPPRPVHYVPTAEGFAAAVRAGLGWGMYPQELVQAETKSEALVRVSEAHLDVPLYWQCWKLDSPMVQAVTGEIRAAAAGLRVVSRSRQREGALDDQ